MAGELSRAGKIRQAAAYIEKHGLHKGQSFETSVMQGADFRLDYSANMARGEKCCTWGALEAHGVKGAWELAERLGFDGSDLEIWEWNDAAERTKDEVVQALLDWADAVEDAQPE